jgi:hypothetical protein
MVKKKVLLPKSLVKWCMILLSEMWTAVNVVVWYCELLVPNAVLDVKSLTVNVVVWYCELLVPNAVLDVKSLAA